MVLFGISKGDDALSRERQVPPPQRAGLSAETETGGFTDGTPASGSSPKPRGAHTMGAQAYRLCCYVGLRTMRRYRALRRRALRTAGFVAAAVGRLRTAMVRSAKIFALRNGIPLDAAGRLTAAIANGSRAARKKGPGSLLLYWLTVALAALVKGAAHLLGSINYVAPLLAATVFAFVVSGTLNMSFALRVTYNGEEIGYIADEAVFENAEKQMRGRIVFEDYIKPDDAIPSFTIATVRKEQLISEDSLTDHLIQASGNELAEATGLYVDNQFLGAVTDRGYLLNLLSSIKDKYRSESLYETVEFVKKVEARDGLYPLTSVISVQDITREANREESQQRVYTAVKGDAPITIAQKNGIPYAQLKALNPGIESSLLVGQEVLVQKSVPMLEVKVVRRETEEVETNFKIEQIQDASQYQGYVKVTQKGHKGVSQVTSEVTYVDGIETSRMTLDTRVVKEPINEKVVVGGKRPLEQIPVGAQTTSSSFIWPVSGGYISCRINGYWGHTGMDIAANYGTAIYASAAGTVTKVNYNSYGYGYHILISHGGGVETLYGHNSKIHVKAGDWVEQGQLIAAVGRTGRASGNHCHFEIRINGRYMDPEKYVGSICPY
jgi:murein DD-endopeptidase MepM/ murein hydrolase activator NlpD